MKHDWILGLGLLSLFACTNSQPDTTSVPPTETASPTPTTTPTPSGPREPSLDVTYRTIDGQPQTIDIYYPRSGGPWPVFFYIHGGGWMGGDKSEGAGWKSLNDYGYLVVSVNYRMYPAYTFPAMIEDVKCAVRFLRAHAAEYNLDPNRIVAAGASAGGHLANLLGMTDASAGWDVGEYRDQSSRVQGVFAMAGPTDLTLPFPLLEEAIDNVFNSALDTPQSQRANGSPINYISPDDPPFLLFHGDQDPYVPVEQAQLFHECLQAAGVKSTLVIVQNGDHGLGSADGSETPKWDVLWPKLTAFLRESLQ
jgi:acetyl esterase/lipase